MSSSTLQITINGKRHVVPGGLTILKALHSVHLDVPRLCHDDRIRPAGACRLCLVGIVGQSRPATACNTPATDGMGIETHSAPIEALRRTNLSLIARNYPARALAGETDHPFHQLLRDYGVDGECRQEEGPPHFIDETHPYLAVAMDRCIHCYRCVRICEEVQGADVWQVWGRGPETRVAPRGGLSLLEAGCVSCGACSDTCPTSAIYDRRESPAEQWTPSTCAYCGVGCQLNVGTANGRVVAIRPLNAEVNAGHLCVKGRYAWDFNHAPDRVTAPMIRRDGEWQPVTWDEALDETVRRLQAIIRRDGPQAVGMVGSARATNEENYYAQKFARVVLGTHNIDCCARVCHQPTAAAMKMMLGTGAATNSFDDIERATTILIAGSNPVENHPIVGARILQAARRGARLIVVDPRRTPLAGIAEIHLAVRPGGNVPLFNAMAATLVEEGLCDMAFIDGRVDGLDDFRTFIAGYQPELVADQCGVPAGLIRAAARLYARNKPSMCIHGLGMTEHLQGTEGVMTLVNLALLTGNLGQPGAGINPLRGQNNVQGSAHMGCEPKSLTGGQGLEDARARFEKVWGVPLPTHPGLTLLKMMDAAKDGRLRALWCMGYDVYLTLANEAVTARSMEALELVVIQDLFMNRTAEQFGHIFLPAASVFEKDGTFMNSDRRVQRIRAALPPAGQSKSDAWILAEAARRMGFERHFAHPTAEAIWNEIRAVWPGGAGLAWPRLELNPPQWPCPDESHPGTPILHAQRFAHAERTSLRCIPYLPSPETVDREYPFRLTTGRHLYQFNAGTMTQRTGNALLHSEDLLEMSPGDGKRLGIADGTRVIVESRHGRIELAVRLMDRIKSGELFTTFHHPGIFVNRVTSSVRDRLVDAPEYKLTAVRVLVAKNGNGPQTTGKPATPGNRRRT
jgi:formate dehydrogenase major subunit